MTILFCALDVSNKPRLNLPPKDPNMDIMFLYMNNFVIFYVIKFWRILYIYYNKKVKKIKVKKIHFEILKISLTASLHICSILNVRLIS